MLAAGFFPQAIKATDSKSLGQASVTAVKTGNWAVKRESFGCSPLCLCSPDKENPAGASMAGGHPALTWEDLCPCGRSFGCKQSQERREVGTGSLEWKTVCPPYRKWVLSGNSRSRRVPSQTLATVTHDTHTGARVEKFTSTSSKAALKLGNGGA